MPTWWFITLTAFQPGLVRSGQSNSTGQFQISQPSAFKFQSVCSYSTWGVGKVSLDPWYITGFSDGEGCFLLAVNKHKRFKLGYSLGAVFQIHLHSRDLALLERVKDYFGVGKVYVEKNGSIQYKVSSIKDLRVIIDHFDRYPLVTSKWADYILFRQGVELMERKAHLSVEGLNEFLALKASVNWGLSESLVAAFPDIVPVGRSGKNPVIPSSNWWLSGLIDAEGCFMIKKVDSQSKGQRIHVFFQITQHVRDINLMENITKFLDCGRLYEYRDGVDLRVTKILDVTEKIIPLLEEYPLQGVKAEDYLCFKEIAFLIKNKEHLTPEGVDKIKQLKLKMDDLKPKNN